MRLLPAVLSVTAGSVDTIGFLGLGGLFIAHVTGNLVILSTHLVSGDTARLAEVLAIPVFIAVLCLTRLLAGGLEALHFASLQPLLFLQFLLLAGFFVLSVAADPSADPDAPVAVTAGMLGVAAMGVQNALVQVSLTDAPATAVMTTNITRFTMDVGTVLLGRSLQDVASARNRVKHTWPAIVGFALGCGFGAASEAAFGLSSVMVPTSLALLAFGLSFSGKRDERESP